MSTMENETLEQQTNGLYNDSERVVDSANQNQVIGSNIDDKIGKAVDNVVMTVENRMHDAIFTAMDKVIIPRVEMAVRSITGSSGRGHNSVVKNPNRGDFTRNTENTPLISASSRRLDINVNQNRFDETRDRGFRGWRLSGIKT